MTKNNNRNVSVGHLYQNYSLKLQLFIRDEGIKAIIPTGSWDEILELTPSKAIIVYITRKLDF